MRGSRQVLAALAAAALCAEAASAQGPAEAAVTVGDGMIVKVEAGNLVFIDKGQADGVSVGELFDIISSETLVHPLTDSVMAVTPKSVGAIRVMQVYPRTSLARLVLLDKGEDPMLKPVARVRDAERLEQIEQQLTHGMRAAAGMDVPRRAAVIPGLYQQRIGEIRKGRVLMAAEAAALVGAFAYRSNSNDWYDQYQRLPAGLPESDYDFYFAKANDLHTRSSWLFWLAGALYAYNWVDAMWLGAGANLGLDAPEHGATFAGLGASRQDRPLLTVTHRF